MALQRVPKMRSNGHSYLATHSTRLRRAAPEAAPAGPDPAHARGVAASACGFPDIGRHHAGAYWRAEGVLRQVPVRNALGDIVGTGLRRCGPHLLVRELLQRVVRGSYPYHAAAPPLAAPPSADPRRQPSPVRRERPPHRRGPPAPRPSLNRASVWDPASSGYMGKGLLPSLPLRLSAGRRVIPSWRRDGVLPYRTPP